MGKNIILTNQEIEQNKRESPIKSTKPSSMKSSFGRHCQQRFVLQKIASELEKISSLKVLLCEVQSINKILNILLQPLYRVNNTQIKD
jgi:hypothetical protein